MKKIKQSKTEYIFYWDIFYWTQKNRYGCGFLSLKMLKYFTAEDLFLSKCWNKVELWIYSNQKNQNKAQLGICCIEKAEIRYSWGQPLLSASFRCKRKCLKDYPRNLTKYEINKPSIFPVYQLFIVNIVNYSYCYCCL